VITAEFMNPLSIFMDDPQNYNTGDKIKQDQNCCWQNSFSSPTGSYTPQKVTTVPTKHIGNALLNLYLKRLRLQYRFKNWFVGWHSHPGPKKLKEKKSPSTRNSSSHLTCIFTAPKWTVLPSIPSRYMPLFALLQCQSLVWVLVIGSLFLLLFLLFLLVLLASQLTLVSTCKNSLIHKMEY
jgi:hypothetical protein